MCNLYEYDMTQEDMRLLLEHYKLVGQDFAEAKRWQNAPRQVYPNQDAPVVRSIGCERVLTTMRWGFPPPSRFLGTRVITNLRNTESPFWLRWLAREHRCVVPVTAFAELDKNISKPVVFRWFAQPDQKPFFLAGIWRPWSGDRGTNNAPDVRDWQLFSLLTTEPNSVVKLFNKAMPVLLRSLTDVEQWLEGTVEDALELQKPAPDDAIVVVPEKKAA